MRIKQVRAIPLHSTERSLSAGPGACLIEIETDSGIVGIGECCTQSEHDEASLAAQVLVERGIKPILLGKDPLNIRRIWEDVYNRTEWYGRAGIAMYALSGIDVALWDLAGKALGVSVSRLLGGRFREEVRVYASILFDMEDFASMTAEAKKWTKAGYKSIKFGWGQTREASFGLDPDRDEASVKHLREELGPDVDIMVDVGRYVNWSVSHAIRMAKALSKYDIYWLEEPLPQDDVPGYIRLTKNSPIRIAGGEGEYNRYMFERWLRGHAVDIIQPDICRAGGFTEGIRIADMAQFHNITLVPHGFSTAVSVAANLQFISAITGGELMEFRRTRSPLMTQLARSPFDAKKGHLKIPDRPGLGIELNEDIVKENRVRNK